MTNGSEGWFADFIARFAAAAWGMPLLVLLLGGGLYFTLLSRLVPFLYFGHAIQILRGRYNRADDPGQITHFQALCSALASTVGMGNISGVAIAIQQGGPGALFWMWVSAAVGMATKFFTCSLSIMFRGRDDRGEIQGGPMYFIVEGLGRRFKPLAVFFSVAGMFGCLTLFQANQLAAILRERVWEPLMTSGVSAGQAHGLNALTGVCMAIVVGAVIVGGIRRIGRVASKLVPLMVGFYVIGALWILARNLDSIPAMLQLIVTDAFTGNAVAGGALGTVVVTGLRRAAFSNEAGIGTETMAHGAARTAEPIREGLVAMIGPFIDTIVVCTMTALVILATGVWTDSDSNGVTLTAEAFSRGLPTAGPWLMMLCVLCFSVSTMIGYSYYGGKCAAYLMGSRAVPFYNYFYLAALVVGAMLSIDVMVNFVDSMFALMTIPTMTAAVLLSPRVLAASRDYFAALKTGVGPAATSP